MPLISTISNAAAASILRKRREEDDRNRKKKEENNNHKKITDMTKNKEELEFLENYYKFWLKKNRQSSFASFVATATKTLVQSGQISQETISVFEKTFNLQQELNRKEKEVDKLKKEIEDLKRQLNVKPPTFNDGCRGPVISGGRC